MSPFPPLLDAHCPLFDGAPGPCWIVIVSPEDSGCPQSSHNLREDDNDSGPMRECWGSRDLSSPECCKASLDDLIAWLSGARAVVLECGDPPPLASPLKPLSGPLPRLVENESQNVKGRKSLCLAGWPASALGWIWGRATLFRKQEAGAGRAPSTVGEGSGPRGACRSRPGT